MRIYLKKPYCNDENKAKEIASRIIEIRIRQIRINLIRMR